MSVSKNLILNDIRRVAADLQRRPTRDEYFGRAGKALGKITEHQIKLVFGTFSEAVEAAIPPSQYRPSVIDKEGLKIVQLTEELSNLKAYCNELEDESLNSHKMRQLIGALTTTRLNERTDWLLGPQELKGSLTGIPTLFLSDWHFDEVVKPQEVNYVNEFNREIAVTRIKHTFQTAIDLTHSYLSKPKYDGVICALGGDMFSGNIHDELAETNEHRILESIMALEELLALGISGLADQFKRVFVPCVVGNHSRLHKKPRYKGKVHDNFEWLLYQMLQKEFKNDDRVTFLIPDAPDAQWMVYDRTYNLNHGDQFKGGSGIAGVFSPLMLGMARKQKKQNAIGQPFDVMMNGHWHQYIHTDSLIINGSLKGYDEFANNHNFNHEPPQQALWISHPAKRETFRMPVLCDEVPKLKRKRGAHDLSWKAVT